MVKCEICDNEFETLDSIRRHNIQKHKMTSEETYLKYVLNGVKPKCSCGCGEETKFKGIELGYSEYKVGHSSRIKNNWGHNEIAKIKSKETQKKLYSEGKLVIWNKGLTIEDERVKNYSEKIHSNPERGKNISKKLKGVKKSSEHIDKIKEHTKLRWEDKLERDKQSERLILRLLKNNYRNKKTKLEETFENFLKLIGFKNKVDYIYQYQVSSAIFDFFIINKNTLIEVDGDFHHCNPNTQHKIPNYPIQLKTVSNDIRKNRISEEHGFKLLRFWEKDIKETPELIIETLKKELLN